MKRLLGISIEECMFHRREFWMGDPAARNHLESVGKAFLSGYNLALQVHDHGALAQNFNALGKDFSGFAFEGAAMAMTILDAFTPWQASRVLRFLRGVGRCHRYMVHVGMGWALARLPRWIPVKTSEDSLLHWLALDGYGFHEGYFKPKQFCSTPAPKEPKFSGYAARAFDQGLGRSMWFVHGANVDRIRHFISRFPASRRPDLWSGIGLACTYAGGCGEATIRQLKAATDCTPQLAQGAAFAAKARLEADLLVPHTVLACAILCDSSPESAALETDKALASLPPEPDIEPRYEIWRRNIQAAYANKKREYVTTQLQMDQASA